MDYCNQINNWIKRHKEEGVTLTLTWHGDKEQWTISDSLGNNVPGHTDVVAMLEAHHKATFPERLWNVYINLDSPIQVRTTSAYKALKFINAYHFARVIKVEPANTEPLTPEELVKVRSLIRG